MFVEFLSLVLIWLPGVLLLSSKPLKERHKFAVLDRVIIGSLFWMFYLVVSTYLWNFLLSFPLHQIYWSNFWLSILVMLHWFITNIRQIARTVINLFRRPLNGLTIKSSYTPVYIFLILAGLSIVLTAIFTPLMVQYDAVARFLPMTRNILNEQVPTGLTHLNRNNPFVIPILYSYILFFGGITYLRFIPILFLTLILGILYRLGKELPLDSRSSDLVPLLGILSMVGIQYIFSGFSLYLDLGFTLFIASIPYTLLLTKSQGEKIKALAVGTSLFLVILSKENGLFYAWPFFVVSLLSNFNQTKAHKWLTYTLSFTLIVPFAVYYIVTSVTLHGTVPLNLYFMYRIVLLSIFIILFSRIAWNEFTGHTFFRYKKSMLLLLLPLILALFCLFRNFTQSGSFFAAYYDPYLRALAEQGIYLTSLAPQPPEEHLMLHKLFLNNIFVGSNLIPLVVGILSIFISHEKQTPARSIILLWFLYGWLVFSALFFNSLEGHSIRHILPIVPSLALLIREGVSWIQTKIFSSISGNHLYLIPTSLFTLSLMTSYGFWTKWWLAYQSTVATKAPVMSISDVLSAMGAWLPVLVLSDFLRKNIRSVRFNLNHLFKRIFVVISIGVLAIPFAANFVIINKIAQVSWDPSYANEYVSISNYSNNEFLEVINFCRTQIPNKSVKIMGIGLGPLLHYVDNPFIELAAPPNIINSLPILKVNDSTTLITKLLESDIRYFLIPTPSSGFRYTSFKALSKSTNLFDFVVNSTNSAFEINNNYYSFSKLHSFAIFDLYELAILENVQMTVIIDDNQTEFWELHQTGDGSISAYITDNFTEVKQGNNTLVIRTGYGVYRYWYLKHTFQNWQNWTSYDYIALFFYGENTGAEIAITMDTPDIYNRGEWRFIDNFHGWKLLIFQLDRPHIVTGNYDPSKIQTIYIISRTDNKIGSWKVDSLFLIQS